MSLINEALKRAKQVQVAQPALPLETNSLQPALTAPSDPVPVIWLFSAAILVVLLGFCFLFISWRGSHDITPRAPAARAKIDRAPAIPSVTASAAPGPAAAATDSAMAVPGSSRTLASTAAPPSIGAQTNQPAALAATNTPAPRSGPEPKAVPELVVLPDSALANLKVQGIFYRSANASALINGRSVFRGDEIAGGTVVGIDREAVRLRFNGRTNVLRLN